MFHLMLCSIFSGYSAHTFRMTRVSLSPRLGAHSLMPVDWRTALLVAGPSRQRTGASQQKGYGFIYTRVIGLTQERGKLLHIDGHSTNR